MPGVSMCAQTTPYIAVTFLVWLVCIECTVIIKHNDVAQTHYFGSVLQLRSLGRLQSLRMSSCGQHFMHEGLEAK